MDKEKDLRERMKQWDDFHEWCKLHNLKPHQDWVLRKYVKERRRANQCTT